MAGWSEVGLVLAGSVGPLLVTVVTQRSARRERFDERQREDRLGTQSLYAELVAACAQVDAEWWSDHAVAFAGARDRFLAAAKAVVA